MITKYIYTYIYIVTPHDGMEYSISTSPPELFFPWKVCWNNSSFWSRNIISWLFFPDTFSSDHFFAGGICGISSFRGTGTLGTDGVRDTAENMGIGISNASYFSSIGNSSLLLGVTYLIYLGFNWFKYFLPSNLLPLSMYITLSSLLVIIPSSQKLFPPL